MQRLPAALLLCLLALAPAGAQTGRGRKAEPVFDGDPFAAALHVVRKMDADGNDRVSSFHTLAKAYMTLGRFDDARRTASLMEDGGWKSFVLGELANRLAAAGRLDESAEALSLAIKTLDDEAGWPDDLSRGALRALVGDDERFHYEVVVNVERSKGALARLIEAGRTKRAAELLEAAHEFMRFTDTDFGDDQDAALVLANVARRYVELGDAKRAARALAEAAAAARRTEDDHDRVTALCAVAEAYVAAGQREEATKILDEAFTAGSTPRGVGRSALTEVASLYARLGMQERALSAVGALASEDEKARALAVVARSWRETGREEEVAGLQLRALEAIPSYYSDGGKSRALAEFLRKGTDSPAVLAKIAEAARSLGDLYLRAQLLFVIADRHRDAGRAEMALGLLVESLQTLYTVELQRKTYGSGDIRIDNDREKVELLRTLARRFLAAGELERVAEAARAIEANYWHALTLVEGGGGDVAPADLALAGLSDELLRAGRRDEALEVLAAAVRVVGHDGENVSPYTRIDALAAIGSIYARAGDKPRAIVYFRRALQSTADLEDHSSGSIMTELLARIGSHYTEAGLKPDPRARQTLRRIVREIEKEM